MPVTINGTTGIVTPAENTTALTVGSITGILKASSGVVSQATAGSDYGQITLATAQTASGTAVDFTGIPSWAKRISVILNGVSTSGTSNILIQIGSGSMQTTGYSSTASTVAGTIVSNTNGYIISSVTSSSDTRSGISVIMNISGNSWVVNGIYYKANTLNTHGGDVTISSTLDRLRITTVNGTDTFDAGTINISYE